MSRRARAPLRPFLLLVAALVAAGCAGGDPYYGEPHETHEQPFTLEPDSFYAPRFQVAWPALVRATVTVTEGGPVDVWLQTGESCRIMGAPSGDDPLATAFGTSNATLDAPLGRGMACLALDNSDQGPGAATPGAGVVQGTVRIELWMR